MSNEEWLRENIKPITKDDLLRLASKIEVPEHPTTVAKHEQEMWDTLVRLAPNIVNRHMADAYDEGVASVIDNVTAEDFYILPNPYRGAGA